MAERNEDKMKAKVPFWFQQILGWESRILVRRWKACFWCLISSHAPLPQQPSAFSGSPAMTCA
jgi:hypothetical protein